MEPTAATQLDSNYSAPSTNLYAMTGHPLRLLTLTPCWAPAAPARARTACPLLGGLSPPVASGSQIRPLGLAISRKQLGRTGSHSAGQPRPPQLWPIPGQIFWEPLYKPQLGSQLFPGKRGASRSPAAGWPCGCWDRGAWELRAGQGAGAPARAQADPHSIPMQPLCLLSDTGQRLPL